VSYEYPRAKPWDIAFGPTLRAAAMHQNLKSPGLKIETNDIRIKVRESKAPLTIVILLDMSESMSISLPNIRNAILSMHDIAYKKHDRIGLVVFKGSGATILQPPTTNLDLVVAKLRDVGASDLTPLASGMFQSWQLLRNERMRNRNTVPVLAIISDGIANVTLSSPLSPLTRSKFMNYAQADAIDAAFLLQREGIHVLVINPSHSPGGELRDSLAHAELAGTIDRIWLEPTELLMRILAITGGSYYGIGEGGTLEDINLTKVFGGFSR
jgi:Mg-chelatase subunit ChlD